MWACGTHVPAIEYESVVDVLPVGFGDEGFEVFGDFGEVGIVGELKAQCKALDMGVGSYPFPYVMYFAEYDIGCLVRDAG